MTIQVSLRHLTLYRYDRLTQLSPQLIRLKPAPHCRSTVLSYSLNIEPKGHFLNWQQDPFGNFAARVVFPDAVRSFKVDVSLICEMKTINPFDFFVESQAESLPFVYSEDLKRSLNPYLEIQERGPKLMEILKNISRSAPHTVTYLVNLNQLIKKEIKYCIRMEAGVQSCEETLNLRSGSCRDSAWLLVQILRHLGLAARFVSGYLIQLKPDQKPLDGPSGSEKDFTDLHAWAEVYLPGAGWLGMDATSGLLTGEGHIPLSCTPLPSDAAPITGSASKSEVQFDVEMQITRFKESSRVTAPISDEEWVNVLKVGNKVESRLIASDLQLTHGGELTFVSIDNPDAEEWNTAALGDEKLILAENLFMRLARRFAHGGFLHFGQGKWYPGEALPRWALAAYWRKDGVPIWEDRSLFKTSIEGEEKPAPQKTTVTSKDVNVAKQLAIAITKELKLSKQYIHSAYEDFLYHLWKEANLPNDFDPIKHPSTNSEDRKSLLKVLDAGITRCVGYVIPLKEDRFGNITEWRSGNWNLRREQLILTPGDSPIGYRLPIGSLEMTEKQEPYPLELSSFAPREPLPDRAQMIHLQEQNKREGNSERDEVIRTALCVEERKGQLYVFFPPLSFLESWLELCAALEGAAKSLGVAIRPEGYGPPSDPRIQVFKITPDPGVIEVNIHPANNWNELVNNSRIVFEEARLCRLTTEKFQLDGRHTGTGGGNHVVLGAETPEKSPFLRRPHLLRSMINFWQNHPSLSYLFSGMFIGPTSQAPRVDEARDSVLNELSIAFSQVSEGDALFPWEVDRIFRHLLTDLTGNTHRSEICIDKLYNPDSLSGRLGLVEFRGFEMPPHVRMHLVQSLLMRALVASFWEKPYKKKLQAWGTALHDRWMLPHFIWRDFLDVLNYLKQSNIHISPTWFTSFLEFRFPVLGLIHISDITLELRVAAEPWLVLGEEASQGGTARYVDSSLERLQIKVSGLSSERHRVICNGKTLPLHNTGIDGEYVSGLRYRAWQPPSCLQPLIGVHSPLQFDVIDLWSELSLGGCTYHVVHPAGRNYETFPVNAWEAEARRAARFETSRHEPGSIVAPSAKINSQHPYSLDLRDV